MGYLHEQTHFHNNSLNHREILTLDDGGVLALDWAANLPAECEKGDAPVLLFLSGITGSSSDNYVKYSMLDGIRHGYRPLVMNYRGCGGIKLNVSLHVLEVTINGYLRNNEIILIL